MSILADIADAITSEINAQSWSLDFIATRQNAVRLRREQACDVSVTVTPNEKTSETITRNKTRDICTFYVGIQKALTSDDNSQTDELIDLGEEIQEYFDQGLPLTDYPTTVCEATSFGADTDTPWMNVQDQDQLLLYTGVVRLTFRIHR